jgi:hypothetical protein
MVMCSPIPLTLHGSDNNTIEALARYIKPHTGTSSKKQTPLSLQVNSEVWSIHKDTSKKASRNLADSP